MAENTQADVKKLSFERAMEELESIVTRLEGGYDLQGLKESVAAHVTTLMGAKIAATLGP